MLPTWVICRVYANFRRLDFVAYQAMHILSIHVCNSGKVVTTNWSLFNFGDVLKLVLVLKVFC